MALTACRADARVVLMGGGQPLTDESLKLFDREPHAATDVDRGELAVPDQLVQSGAPDAEDFGSPCGVHQQRTNLVGLNRAGCGRAFVESHRVSVCAGCHGLLPKFDAYCGGRHGR